MQLIYESKGVGVQRESRRNDHHFFYLCPLCKHKHQIIRNRLVVVAGVPGSKVGELVHIPFLYALLESISKQRIYLGMYGAPLSKIVNKERCEAHFLISKTETTKKCTNYGAK
jgi:hypothetical protein